VFLALDKRLADIRVHEPSEYNGIVLVRSPSDGRTIVRQFVLDRVAALLNVELAGRLRVMGESGLRVRR